MNGVRKARSGNCGRTHNLIYNLIAYPLLVLFATLLWIAVAALSFGLGVNLHFCGFDTTNNGVLDLLSGLGYEYSMFYYYTDTYMQVRKNAMNEL